MQFVNDWEAKSETRALAELVEYLEYYEQANGVICLDDDAPGDGREVVGSTFSPFEVWFSVALMYLILTGGLSWLVHRMERRLRRHD